MKPSSGTFENTLLIPAPRPSASSDKQRFSALSSDPGEDLHRVQLAVFLSVARLSSCGRKIGLPQDDNSEVWTGFLAHDSVDAVAGKRLMIHNSSPQTEDRAQ